MCFQLSFYLTHFEMHMVSSALNNSAVQIFAYERPFISFAVVVSCAGKVVNIKHLDEVINSIDGWYVERGLFGLVSN